MSKSAQSRLFILFCFHCCCQVPKNFMSASDRSNHHSMGNVGNDDILDFIHDFVISSGQCTPRDIESRGNIIKGAWTEHVL